MSTRRESFLLERELLRSRSALCRLRLRRESRVVRESLRWPMAAAGGAALAAALLMSTTARPRGGGLIVLVRRVVFVAGIARSLYALARSTRARLAAPTVR